MKKTLLLCTFASVDTLDDLVQKIQDTYSLAFKSIYILQNTEDENQFILTYNIVGDKDDIFHAPAYTISVHRKKQSNTIYTINAINLLMVEKIGHIDKNYKIEWEELENMVLCTAYGKLKKISTKIHKVIKLD
jgi:hypothetical protein